jgi:hypothetical protein
MDCLFRFYKQELWESTAAKVVELEKEKARKRKGVLVQVCASSFHKAPKLSEIFVTIFECAFIHAGSFGVD